MKTLIFTTILFLTTFLLQAQQTTVRLYGFRQQITGGMQKAGDIDSAGNFVKKKMSPRYHYAIYLSTASKARIEPIAIWLFEKVYSVETETLTQPPVAVTNVDAPAAAPRFLFPRPAGRIYKLEVTAPLASGPKAKGRRLAKENDVVFVFKSGGRLHYGVLKKCSDADIIPLQ